MSYSKLIHDYLDGELNGSEQDMLFSELSANSEVRTEFNQQMKLHLIAQNDMATITPPVSTTNAIFSQLGFSIPTGDFRATVSTPTEPSKTAAYAAIWSFFKRYSPNLFTAIVAAGLTGIILFFLLKHNGQPIIINPSTNSLTERTIQTEPAFAVDGTTTPVNGSINQQQIASIISRSMDEYYRKLQAENAELYRSLAMLTQQQRNNTSDYTSVERDGSMTDNLTTFYNSGSLRLIEPPNTIIESNKPIVTNNTQQLAQSIMPLKSDNSRFGIEFRGVANSSPVKVNVDPKSNPWFKNVSLGLNYQLSDYHALGVEVGQESFPQVFQNTIDGQKLTQYQNPNLVWYGGTYKLSLKDMIVPNVLYPFVQVFGGATSVGPLGRVQAGFQFKPADKVTFTIGGEAAMLLYNVQGNVYNTNKYGVTYGVSINY